MNIRKVIKMNKWGEVREKSFSDLTTMKVGGIMKNLFYPNSLQSLIEATKYFSSLRLPYKVIGNGSNIIASDRKFTDIIISCKYIKQSLIINDDEIIVSAFHDLRRLNGFLVGRNISSLLFMAGIPGTVGGAIYMNAGAHGKAIADSLLSVTYLLDGLIYHKDVSALEFGYRSSYFQSINAIIIEARFKRVNDSNLYDKYHEYVQYRKETQPLTFPNAGSIFRNPPHMKAYQVITDLNLKGYEINGAKFSDLHANFIINRASAKGKDVHALIQLATEKAKEAKNIDLVLEVELWNFKE